MGGLPAYTHATTAEVCPPLAHAPSPPGHRQIANIKLRNGITKGAEVLHAIMQQTVWINSQYAELQRVLNEAERYLS